MKIFLTLLLLFFCSNANADVYVLLNSDSEVLAAGNEDDAVLQDGQTKIVMPGKLQDYDLQYAPPYYKIKNGKFVVNTAKITAEIEELERINKETAELLLIDNRVRKDACDALEGEGVRFTVVKCDSFK